MARDFEDISRLDDLSDDELQALIREQLGEYDTLDVDNILVRVEDGKVRLSGRVGTEAERRIAEHVVTDVVGVQSFTNDIAVDPIRRDLEPEAIDDHLGGAVARGEDQLGGKEDMPTDPENMASTEEDLDARLYGTHNLQEAISEGMSWDPPDTPTPEGLAGQEDPDEGLLNEDH